jgi:nucleoid-associated protein YgaU
VSFCARISRHAAQSRRARTWPAPILTEKEMDQKTHQVVAGESLSSIAHKYYGHGDEAHWMKIYEANKAVLGSNPDMITPKMENGKEVFPTLVIPA